MSLKIQFDQCKQFSPDNLRGLERVVGIYFIASTDLEISYPFKKSRLLYIGMSEKTSNSIASRLKEHFDGTSGNLGLTNYRKVQPLVFTYINFEALKSFWRQKIEDLESRFIQDFVQTYGVYPICNNKTGFPEFNPNHISELQIDWSIFERAQ